jgi:hypothetical protein
MDARFSVFGQRTLWVLRLQLSLLQKGHRDFLFY